VTIYLVIPLLVIVAFLQTTIMPHLAIWDVFPDLPVLVVVSWSLLRGPREGVVWGFIQGVAVDLLSGAPFGAATLSLIAAGALAGLSGTTAFRAHFALPLLTMFVATIVYDMIFLLMVQISGDAVSWLDTLFRIVLPSAVLNTILTPLVLGGTRILHNRFRKEEMEW
jgi:rod shape-determining protein MreD